MDVPFGTMSVTESSKKLIAQILDSGRLTSGKYVREFEQRFAELIGTREAVAVSTGTDADTLALAVIYDYGAQRGDEVIVPALSFVATGNAVLHAGFSPVFVDVEMDSFNIDPARIEAAISERTVAIMPVHLMGKPAEMDEINRIAGEHDLFVIEDAAEAHCSKYKGRNIGTLGDMAAYSTYAAHMISTIEGGIITTNDMRYAEILRSLRSHGRACNCADCVMNAGATYCAKRFVDGKDIRFNFERIGYSCKMNELEAAVGIGNLEAWPQHLASRKKNLQYLLDAFKQFAPDLMTFRIESYEEIGPHAFPIIVGPTAKFSRDQLVSHLSAHRIDSRHMFLSMPTQCPGFAFLGYKLGQFTVSEYIGEHGLHIGIHQDLNLSHMEYIVGTLAEFIKKHA